MNDNETPQHSTAQEAMYAEMAAMDNQDEPLENYSDRLVGALYRAGFAIIPVVLPADALGEAAVSGAASTGNPKHLWDFLILRVMVKPLPSDAVICKNEKTESDDALMLRVAKEEIKRQAAEIERLQQWKRAVDDACVVSWVPVTDYASETVKALIDRECQIALDPLVSCDAQALIGRGEALALAEIERLKSRLEVSPDHPYDGIASRDATINLQEDRITELEAGRAEREIPLYAAPPVTAPVRLTDDDKDGLAVPYSGMGGVEDYRAYAQAIETAVLRANGFKAEE